MYLALRRAAVPPGAGLAVAGSKLDRMSLRSTKFPRSLMASVSDNSSRWFLRTAARIAVTARLP